MDVDDAKLDIAKKAGADYSVNTSDQALHQRLLELTDGLGPDVIIEAIGLLQIFRAAVEEVAFAGRVVYIEHTKEPVTYETRLFVKKDLDVMGSRNALPGGFRHVIQMLEQRLFPVEEAVTPIVRIEEAPALLRAWPENPSRFSKIMVSME